MQALVLQQFQLGAAGLQQRFLLRQIESGRHAQLMARADEFKRLLLQLDAAQDHVNFRIALAQAEVVAGQFRQQHQARVLEIGSGLLGRSLCRMGAAAHPAEQVGLVVDGQAQLEVILRHRLGRRAIRGQRPVGRALVACRARLQADCRQQRRRHHRHLRARLFQAAGRLQQILVMRQRLLRQRVQLRILVQLPPSALQGRVVRRGGAELRVALPRGGQFGQLRLLVGRFGGAGRQQRSSDGRAEDRARICVRVCARVCATSHQAHGAFPAAPAAPVTAVLAAFGASVTTSLSANESGGFSTILSLTVKPLRISSVLPRS